MGDARACARALALRHAVIGVFLFDAAAIVACVLLGAASGDVKQQFTKHGLITWLSGLHLLAVSGLCWYLCRLHRREPVGARARGLQMVWLLLALAFAYLALDEVLELHERADALLHRVFHVSETPMTDRLDDLIVLIYGMCGVGFICWHRPTLRRYRCALPLAIIAFVLLFAMVAADAVGNDRALVCGFFESAEAGSRAHRWLCVAEDSLKLLAEGAFVAATVCCLFAYRSALQGPACSATDAPAGRE